MGNCLVAANGVFHDGWPPNGTYGRIVWSKVDVASTVYTNVCRPCSSWHNPWIACTPLVETIRCPLAHTIFIYQIILN